MKNRPPSVFIHVVMDAHDCVHVVLRDALGFVLADESIPELREGESQVRR